MSARIHAGKANTIKLKVCPACDQSLPASEFPARNRRGVKHPTCRRCLQVAAMHKARKKIERIDTERDRW
jgi:hypothetical protein